MKVIEPGHVYQLQHVDGSGAGLLVFVNREPGTEHEGTQTQEILRALIDRTQHCNSCRHWDGNKKIIHHLRMALALHESRAIERKTEKGELNPETLPTGSDGHFVIAHPTVHLNNGNDEPYCRVVSPQHMTADPSETTCERCSFIASSGKKIVDAMLDEPKTTDYCRKCGESPESATHYGLGPSPHSFEDPRR